MNTSRKDIPKSLFIENPYTGQRIDILPLFELMSERVVGIDGAEDIRYQLQCVHDYVSTTAPSTEESEVDTAEWAAINWTIVHIRQAFERMKEVSL